VTFYIWSAPLFHAFALTLIAACAVVMGLVCAPSGSAKGGDRLLLGLIALGVFVGYIWTMLWGVAFKLIVTVIYFLRIFGVGSAITIWRSLSDTQRAAARESGLAENLTAISKRNWARGLFMCVGVLVLPFVFAVGMLKGCIVQMRDPSAKKTRFSPGIQRLYDWVASFHGGGTMVWMIVWTCLTFELSFMRKLAYVFLSWLAEQIEMLNVFIVAFLLSIGGFLIMMNPFAPGPVYYAMAGLVLTTKFCRDAGDEDGGCPDYAFAYGMALSIICSLATKLAAVVGEMMIGEAFGNKVWVQRIVGVDKPGIRAIEHILMQPGLFLGKIGILCGGPDWPTSVLCGFLRQSRFQMCLGTTPIGITCIPSVFAGSILAMPSDSLWGDFVPLAILGAFLSQGGVVLVALYYINEVTASTDPAIQSFLNDSRPEHAAVEKLSLESAAFDQVYNDVTEIRAQQPVQKLMLVTSLLTAFGSAAAVSAAGSTFFRPFEARSRITDSYDSDPPGLEVSDEASWPLMISCLNLVKAPHGWILLVVHYSSILFYRVWEKSVTSTAKQVLSQDAEAFMENGGKYQSNPHQHPAQKKSQFQKPHGGLTESQEPLTSDTSPIPNEIGAAVASEEDRTILKM
jgi:hypothetical protein